MPTSDYELIVEPEGREVRAWADRWIPFDGLAPWAKAMRTEMRQALRGLRAEPGEILLATYAGPRHPASDVENLLLYNLDASGGTFSASTTHGVRFEAAREAEPAPSGQEWPVSYRYRLARAVEWDHWQSQRPIAAFSDVALPPLRSHILAPTWLALRSSPASQYDRLGPGEMFAVRLALSGLSAPPFASPSLVKGLIDATVSALQAQRPNAHQEEAAERLSVQLGVAATSIAQILTDESRAALGVVDSLVHLRGEGVQWSPADHLCVAGAITLEPGPDGLRLSGTVEAVTPRTEGN